MEPKKIKVLAIDDNRDNLITLEALIQDSLPGSSVFTATEGNAGIKIAVTEDPDVILLDVIMPGMDGFEVCRELKEDNKLRDIPVVFITALQGDKESRINALEIGAEAFLTKPIDVSELTAQIKAMVKIKRANYDERNEKEQLASLVEERTKELKQTHIATLNLLEDLKKENEARRKSEEALRESEDRYRDLVENSSVLICTHDLDGNLLSANNAALKITGYSQDEVLKMNLQEIIVPEYRKIFSAYLKKIQTIGYAHGLMIIQTKTGERRIWEYTNSLRTHGIDKPIVRGMVKDVTERRQAEAKTKAYIHFLESLERIDRDIKREVAVEPMLSSIVNTVFSIFDCDRAWLFYPCDPNVPTFRVPVEVNKPEYPGANAMNIDIPMTQDLADNLREALERSDIVTYAAGTDRPINKVTAEQFGVKSQMMVPIYPKIGKPWVFGMHQCSHARVWTNDERQLFKEISRRMADSLTNLLMLQDLKESEEKYKAITQSTVEVIFTVDKLGKLLFFNESVERVLGYKVEEVIGKSFTKFVHKKDLLKLFMQIKNVFQHKEVSNFVTQIFHKDGHLVDVEINGKLIMQNGKYVAQGSIRDITKRKRAEEALLKSEAELKEAQRVGRLGSWDWNATTDTITWSEEYYRIYGFDPKLSPPGYEEHLNIYTPESALLLDEVVKKSMQTGEEFQLDLELAHAEGTTRWVTAHGEVKYDDKGQIVGLRGTAQDITERKLAEEQIREKDIQFRKLSSNVSGMIFQFTRRLDGTYYVPISSEGIKNIFGCSPEDVQVDFAPISRVIFTEDSARVINDIEYSAKHLTPFTCEFRVQIPGNPIQWIYSKSTPEKLADGSVTWYGFNADITERKRAEEEIIMLANSLKSVNECVSITDLHDRLIFVNDSFLRTYGYEERELIGKHMTIVRSQNNAHELVSKILPATLHGGWQGELLNKRKDGTEFPISLSTTTVKDKKGKIIALIGVASDITNRKHAEEILTNERTLLRTIIDLIPDAVFVKDIDGRKILANKKEIEFSGKYSEDEVIGKTDYDLYPESEAKRYSDEDQAVLKSGIPLLNMEGKLIDKQGQIHWLIGAKVPLLDMHGQITGLVGVNHDFTERKQFEDELLKLLRAVEQSPASVVITDPEGYIEYVNTKFCDVSGYSKDEVAGKNSRMLKSGFQNQEFYAGLWGKILSGKEWSGEFLNKKKNGEQYWESAQISPVINKEGDITHFVAIKEDITEKKKMIQELIVAKDKAEEMSRLKSNFLANMSHELRTPLNGILGYSEILSTSLIDPEQIDMVKGIYQSGKRLSETLKFILDLSEAETGKIEVTAKDISVVPIVKESVLLFTSDAAKKNLKLETTVKDENIMAHLDHILLKRIMHNLIDNAIKFTKEGTINVEVGKEVIRESGKSKKSSALYIKVKDTGIGIPEDKIDLIWEEFRQVSEGISRSYEGPGLGLTISKKAVELMHGTITVESEIGVGSTFTIKFPGILLPSGSNESTVDEGAQEESSTKRRKEKNLSASVLYVEDDFINRNMVKLFLKDTCEVDAAEDGTAALKLLKDKKYDLFLVDINLGEGMNGLQLVKEILKIPQYLHTPIVAVTAYAMGKDKEESLQGGCTHYLAKPFRKQEMISLVTHVINLEGE